jgi:hypothetical protein
MPYAKPVVLYTFDSNGTNSGTGGSNNNAIINGTSVIDTSIANIKIGTGSMFIASGGSTEANSVEIGNMNLSTSAFTISFWLKMNVSSTTDDSRLFHAYYNNSSSDYFLRSNGPGHTSLTLSSSASTVTRTPQVSYNNDSFHHFVITCNSGVHTLYIDNISNTPMNTSPFSGNFNRFRIGGPLRTAGSTIGNGNIDDFRFYNYAADATFVSYLYKLGSNTDIASLSSVAIADLVAAGASVSQLVATGKPVAEIIFYSQWLDLSATSNVFNKTYVNNFVDLSGVMNIRNNSDLVVYGNWMVGGNINTLANNAIIINDMNILSRLFTNSDISVNGNLSMGGDLSVNGQFNSNFADGVIPYNSILFASAGSETVIQGNVKILGDVSFSSPSLELGYLV